MHWQPLSPDSAAPLALAEGELHLWWWPESAQPAATSRRARVDAILRASLAPYLDLPPATLHFGRERKGRPFLREAGAPDFNLSDTVGGSLVGVCRGGRVGIDLERGDRAPPALRLAQRWFASEEAAALAGLEADAARQAFLRLWTAKEAACKATGTGIYGRLAAWRFDVLADPPRVRALPPEAGAAAEWCFLRLFPAPSHTAVAACRGFVPRVRGFVARVAG